MNPNGLLSAGRAMFAPVNRGSMDGVTGACRDPAALVVDRDPSMRRVVRCMLQSRGYWCVEAPTVELMERAREDHVAVVTLTVGEEFDDAVADLASWHEQGAPKILAIGWRDDLPRLVRALESGADEYLIKPFTAAEACSRLDLLFAKPGPSAASSNAGAVELTEEEHRGLVALQDKAGRIATFGHLAKRIWGDAPSRRSDHVRAVMTALRKRIEALEPRPGFIKSELGIGYRLVGAATIPCREGAALERRRAYDSSEAGS